eukprot:530765-Prymnesium_polylepis.1
MRARRRLASAEWIKFFALFYTVSASAEVRPYPQAEPCPSCSTVRFRPTVLPWGWCVESEARIIVIVAGALLPD